eukprot:7149322-Prymnesium_polylepis.1
MEEALRPRLASQRDVLPHTCIGRGRGDSVTTGHAIRRHADHRRAPSATALLRHAAARPQPHRPSLPSTAGWLAITYGIAGSAVSLLTSCRREVCNRTARLGTARYHVFHPSPSAALLGHAGAACPQPRRPSLPRSASRRGRIANRNDVRRAVRHRAVCRRAAHRSTVHRCGPSPAAALPGHAAARPQARRPCLTRTAGRLAIS